MKHQAVVIASTRSNMKTNLPRIRTQAGLALLAASGLALLVGCAGHPRTPAGMLEQHPVLQSFGTPFPLIPLISQPTTRAAGN